MRVWRIVWVALAAFALASPVMAAPRVLATIKPLHALAAGVMAGVGEPALLMEGGVSPHGYAMRPSDASALQRAEVVLWVGPALETFLVRFLDGHGGERVAAQSIPGIHVLPMREGGAWGEHEHDHAGEHEGGIDPHIWLDPANARVIVGHLAGVLGRLDPAHAERYQVNAAALKDRLLVLEQGVARDLAPVRQRPYLVFHDAYHYFEARFGLGAVGAVTLSPEAQPGARWVGELRHRIEAGGVVCLFSEPQFQPRLVGMLVEGSRVRTGELDPLGAALPSGVEMYFGLMEGLKNALLNCLG